MLRLLYSPECVENRNSQKFMSKILHRTAQNP